MFEGGCVSVGEGWWVRVRACVCGCVRGCLGKHGVGSGLLFFLYFRSPLLFLLSLFVPAAMTFNGP